MISIAIPDSLFTEESSLKDKTVKAGIIARSAAIFGVDRIYIYRDMSANYEKDFEIARLILEYAETPQYLRRRLIGKHPALEYVGLLPPLRTPHHVKDAELVIDEIRECALVSEAGSLKADIGSKELANYDGRGHPGQRVTVKVESVQPLRVMQSERPKGIYWGYEVRRAPSLTRFLKSAKFDVAILTSRLGDPIEKKWSDFIHVTKFERILLCYGSPSTGVQEMLRQDGRKPSDFENTMILNLFPNQNVETVRLEEAIIGSLSILNIAKTL